MWVAPGGVAALLSFLCGVLCPNLFCRGSFAGGYTNLLKVVGGRSCLRLVVCAAPGPPAQRPFVGRSQFVRLPPPLQAMVVLVIDLIWFGTELFQAWQNKQLPGSQ